MSLFNTTDLNPTVAYKLEKVGIFSYRSILEFSCFELQKLACLSSEECLQVQEWAAKSQLKLFYLPVPQVKTLNDSRRITLDCCILNNILGGGLPLNGITELYGESGAGKTQFCLQLSLTVQYPICNGGLNTGVVFICTEDKYPINRLNQMMKHFPRDQTLKLQGSFGDRIYVDHIADIDGLKECLFRRLPQLLSSTPVGLVIIDSIAAIYRTEYTFKQTLERSKSIRSIALQLHKINKKFDIGILCTNQVSDSTDTKGKVPALGLVWSNMVTTRLQAFRFPDRILKVVTAPDLPQKICHFTISEGGVFGIDKCQERKLYL